MQELSFIEAQFPVSKLSKESYKERKANNSQTLTGLGKWWGRKPLVLVRAAILGLLIPASDNPKKDRDVFLKLMTMDDEGLWQRRRGNIPIKTVMEYATPNECEQYFMLSKGKWRWHTNTISSDRERMQKRTFNRMSYDTKLKHCLRPEEVEGPSKEAWDEINAHLGISASCLTELVHQLGERRFGHVPRVGDAFCGGGSVPFEAARLGCDAYGSDLNPVGALLTWSAINIIGGSKELTEEIREAQREVYNAVRQQVDEWGIETNEEGWRADYYLYCAEVVDPISGWKVPLAPTWVIGEKTNAIARLIPRPYEKSFDIEILEGVTPEEMEKAKIEGTCDGGLKSPVDGDGNYVPPHLRTTISFDELRGRQGLRLWGNEDIVPRPGDVFQERLYCVRWAETIYNDNGTMTLLRHYRSPSMQDMEREANVIELLCDRFRYWKTSGCIPSRMIEPGSETSRLQRERGWTYWHHLFNPRQLLVNGLFNSVSFSNISEKYMNVACLLGVGRLADWNCRLCSWDYSAANEISKHAFYNQALNTFVNYAVRSSSSLSSSWYLDIPSRGNCKSALIKASDARSTDFQADIWITDPPYADAINYEELSEFFLSWYDRRLCQVFPEWYADSKRALAIRGSTEDFRLSMVECYKKLADHMPDDGFQLVMFTHQDAEVWSDLALILWAAGLRVTAAWTIATETDTSFRTGKYVQGTVLLVLRKRLSDQRGDMSDIFPEVQVEVQSQIRSMLELDDKEDPNFVDSDYQLAAYAAALRVVTGYSSIDDIDVERELNRVRRRGDESPLTNLIRSAVKIASDFLIPEGLDRAIWRGLGPEERFYLKGIEVEAHGEYRDGVYQEFARGFGVGDYRGLLAAGTANQTRLKSPSELKGRDLSGIGFAGSLLRQVLFAVYKTAEEEDPNPGRTYLKQEVDDYWGKRQTILSLLSYIHTRPSAGMAHWQKDAEAAHLLYGSIQGDGV